MRHLKLVDENFTPVNASIPSSFPTLTLAWTQDHILHTIQNHLSTESKVYTWRDCLYLQKSLEQIFNVEFLSDDQIDQISAVVKEHYPKLKVLTIFDPVEDHLHIGIDLKAPLSSHYQNESIFLTSDLEVAIISSMNELRVLSPRAQFKVEKKVKVSKTF